MRLKFRAWDKFNECYYYSDKYKTLAAFFVSMQMLINGGNEIIFQQFTGLLDKNGKEIYDGDHDKDYNVVAWCDRRAGWALKAYDFPTKSFVLCHCYNCEGNIDIMDEPLEIIGNIYEPNT